MNTLNLRYALFQADAHPDGMGWDHFSCVGESIEELERQVKSDSYQIVDLSTLKIVKQGEKRDVCHHTNTYRVHPPSTSEAYSTYLASGAYSSPGLYCDNCGVRVSS